MREEAFAIATAALVCHAATVAFGLDRFSLMRCRKYRTALSSHDNARMTRTAVCRPAPPAARLAATVASPITA
jgi:hypothetical protein